MDGVTDKSGRSYGRFTGGQLAGQLIEQALRQIVTYEDYMSIPPAQLIERINVRFRNAYHDYGITELVARDPNSRFAAQLALVLTDGESFRCILIGDCGLRVNGETLFLSRHPGEELAAKVRAIIYRFLNDKLIDDPQRSLAARAYTVAGMQRYLPDHSSSLKRHEWEGLRNQMLSELPKRHPELEPTLIEQVILTGIEGLAQHRNTASPFAFASIDGFPVPPDLIQDMMMPCADVDVIELFSDGYFLIPKGTMIRDWEQQFMQLERDDPAKVSIVLSTKGSGDGLFTDDRTVMIIRRDVPTYA
jgi:hypothetical protein